MARVAMVESETRGAPAPAAVPAAPEPEALAKAIRELGHLLRVTSNVLRRFTPSPVLDELSELIEKRVRGIEESLGRAE